MIKAIVFDFDGVLVESVDIKTRAFGKLFELEGRGISSQVEQYHINNAGVSRFEKFRYIYKEILNRNLTEEIFKGLCQRFSNLVVDEVVSAPYVNGAKEFLDNYTKLYRCFIASATPQSEIEVIIKRRYMSQYFKEIYGAPRKKADIVSEIILNNDLLHDKVVYIGDALSDYEAARANSVIFIARINNNVSNFDNMDCLKVKDLANLKTILDTL
jgi:HAD superfamily hydrolase (TIGR01549 family)